MRHRDKNVKNALLYAQLPQCKNDDEFVCRVVKTVNEIQTPVEAGFDYVCDMDCFRLFRKTK
jgi:hypothetical protein